MPLYSTYPAAYIQQQKEKSRAEGEAVLGHTLVCP